jgi:2-polyprenyl-3-methyl-5-hydroxy-6-metoxy-1,4-benzoquinol methylase
MQLAGLKSSRYEYDVSSLGDRFSRNRILVEEAQKHSSVLECGCSTGFFSKLISAGGTRVVGIEIDPEAAEQAKRFCSRVLSIDLNQRNWIQGVGERFDLVMFADVLEHLIEPQATLRDTRQLLAPGGRVLISLPNIAYWTARATLLLGKFEYQEVGILDYTHLRFFTVKTARRMIQDAGYRVVRFHPVFADRNTRYLRSMWQQLANLLPNLMAVQMLFLVEPIPEGS